MFKALGTFDFVGKVVSILASNLPSNHPHVTLGYKHWQFSVNL